MIQASKTVLFISHDASRTGAPIFLLRFLQWFREHRQVPFRILVVSPGELLPEFESVGPTDVLEPESILDRIFRQLRIPARSNGHHLESLREKLARTNIGLIYSNTIATGKALNYLTFMDCPVICHVHELEQAIQQCNQDGSLNQVKRRASSYVTVSHAVKRNLVARHGIAEDKISVVHGFIPTGGCAELRVARALVRRELNIPMDAAIVCACGSIEPRKGSDLFLEVAERVAKSHAGLQVHFVWIGGSKDRVKSMRKQAQELSSRSKIHFLGRREDTGPYYQASDVFLLPSREDPFPLVMMEAALYGMPVVCFDNSGGAPEFVQHDAGFSVPGFNVDDMAEKVGLLLASDELRKRMGETGRERVLRHHDINTSAPRMAGIIESALTCSERFEQPRLQSASVKS